MPRPKKQEDYGPVTLEEITKLRQILDDANECLTICHGCGVECDEWLTKIKNLHKLLDKFHEIYTREGAGSTT